MKKIWRYFFVVKPETGETLPVGWMILFFAALILSYLAFVK